MLKNFFRKLIRLDEVGSTNTYLLNGDFENRTIVYTSNQTSGRGRQEKKWIGTPGKNLAVSYLLNEGIALNDQIWFVAVSSLALMELLAKLKVKNAWIKWPNDIYVNNAKLAGILTESVTVGKTVKKLVIGIGINVDSIKEDLAKLDNKATSILIETGKTIGPDAFFTMYNTFLEKWLHVLVEKRNITKIKKNWLKLCLITGKQVEWENSGILIAGSVTGINDDGSIVFRDEKGGVTSVHSGDIRLV